METTPEQEGCFDKFMTRILKEESRPDRPEWDEPQRRRQVRRQERPGDRTRWGQK